MKDTLGCREHYRRSEVSSAARPGRKAGTDRRNTVGTTVTERIPEGRTLPAHIPPGQVRKDRSGRCSERSRGHLPLLHLLHPSPYNAQFLTPWLSFLFLSFSQAARGEIYTGMRIEFSKGDRASSRMLKTTSRIVLGSPTSSTYPRGYASGVSLPAALRDAVLSILGLEGASSR
jgi:hypothetical protein